MIISLFVLVSILFPSVENELESIMVQSCPVIFAIRRRLPFVPFAIPETENGAVGPVIRTKDELPTAILSFLPFERVNVVDLVAYAPLTSIEVMGSALLIPTYPFGAIRTRSVSEPPLLTVEKVIAALR